MRQVKNVGEIFKVVGGGTPTTKKPEYWRGPIPWATSADLGESLDVKPRKKISREAIAYSTTNLVPKGSVVVATRVGLGKVGIAATDLCFSQDCQGIILDSKEHNSKYIALQLKVKVQIFKYTSRGTTISGVAKKQLLDIPISIPAPHEQQRIVEEIEKQFTRLDAGVAALKRIQANLKRYRSAVLKAACEGKLVPTEAELAKKEGRTYETGEELLKRIHIERRKAFEAQQTKNGKKKKYVEPKTPDTTGLPELPEGWTWGSIEQLCDIGSGNTPPNISKTLKKTGEVPWYRVADMNHPENIKIMKVANNYLLKTEIAKLNLRLFPDGTILFPKRGGAISTNKKRYLTSPASTDLNIMGITPNKKIFRYFRWWFESIDLDLLSDGSNVPQINNRNITPVLVPLPPREEQHHIVEEVERRMSIIVELEALVSDNLKRADRLRQAILQKAFEGELVR